MPRGESREAQMFAEMEELAKKGVELSKGAKDAELEVTGNEKPEQ